MSKRVLITGGTGFIGANLTRVLLAGGDDVLVTVKPGSDQWRLDGLDGPRILEADLRESGAAERLLAKEKPQVVFHLAAHGAYSWQTDAELIFETNALVTLRLLQACLSADVERFVNAGSSSEYGYQDHAPSEDELPRPNSAYAVAKLSGTLCCGYFAREHGLDAVTLRLYSAYGPWEDSRRLVPALLRAGLRGELPPLARPDVARDYVFVEDVCTALVAAAAAESHERGAVYNVASGRQTTLAEIVELVRSVFQITAEPLWGSMETRAWDTSSWVGDPTLIASELGWQAETSLEDGLRRTAEWLRRT